MIRFGIIILLLFFPVVLASGDDLTLGYQPLWQLGDHDVTFSSIDSLCEDSGRNLFILDRKVYKIYKFSAEGKLLLTFGQRGQGPGDLAHPASIAVTPDNRLVVCDDMIYVSYFDTQGTFLKRIKIDTGLALRYIRENLFYAWQWLPEVRRQIFTTADGQIVKTFYSITKETNSVAAPDESGRLVSSNYYSPVYSPGFLFATSHGRVVLGRSDRYEITLINPADETQHTIRRDIQPGKISSRERTMLIKEIRGTRRLHTFAQDAFIKKIRPEKNFFRNLLISGRYLFAVRLQEDIGEDSGPSPVDIFNLDGRFLGSSRIPVNTILLSEHALYVLEDEEDLILTKFSFRIGDRP